MAINWPLIAKCASNQKYIDFISIMSKFLHLKSIFYFVLKLHFQYLKNIMDFKQFITLKYIYFSQWFKCCLIKHKKLKL